MGAVFWYTLSLILQSCLCDTFNILVAYPMPTKTHAKLGDSVVRQLIKAGHNVTYVTAFPHKNPPPNLRQIDVSKNADAISPNAMNIATVLTKESSLNDINRIKELTIVLITRTFENENVQKIINDPNERFDVAVVEWMYTDLISGFATIFNCPLIWVSALEVTPEIIGLIDVMPNPAYSSDLWSPNIPPLSFTRRVEHLWTRLKLHYWNYIYHHDAERKEYERLVAPVVAKKGRQPPSYDEVRYNASLMLGNSHVSMGEASTLPQSYKPIGGYHIEEKVQPLPEDLKSIMDNSRNGVIYFSMGSNLQSKDWPEDIKRGFLNMFRGLQQIVIWKFEEMLPDLPQNVHILQWAPQTSILSHPNCVLFISHGGLLSTTETIHFGVPIIGIPALGDQFLNVQRAVSKGFAIKVDLTYDVVNELKAAIDEMISNPKYTELVKILSFIYHHRPMKPGQELVHWVEHVAHLRGATYLRSPAFSTPLYQRLYIDLIAVIIAIIVFVTVIFKHAYHVLCTAKVVGKKKYI